MKIKLLKFCTALVSLLIGFAIVHSFSPRQELEEVEKKPAFEQLEFSNDAVIALDCVYGSAPYKVHFSAYQRSVIKSTGLDYPRAFCEKLPSLGETKITLDFIDKDLRDRSVALKFIYHEQREPSAEALASGQIINESFQQGIPRGFIESRLDFSKAGFYTLIVEFGGGVVLDDEVVKIPFEVGNGL
ncbi:MAG: hypothetical protein KBT88_14545 [Gammaproteobacteria bacterium]|nr:hypothetical protein [Gammaproteobacteria bacterium]MBQ0841003.1 hypothetical protein [Gammaproteobacteria bacterium]